MSALYRISRTDGKPDSFKNYLSRLMKMIPSEVVGFYLVGSGIIPDNQHVGLLIFSIICLFGVIAIRRWGTADPENNLAPQWSAVAISTIAFVIWIYSLGGVFKFYGLHVPWIGSLLVMVWTFFIPIFYKGSKD
jgi:hypothetical protein